MENVFILESKIFPKGVAAGVEVCIKTTSRR